MVALEVGGQTLHGRLADPVGDPLVVVAVEHQARLGARHCLVQEHSHGADVGGGQQPGAADGVVVGGDAGRGGSVVGEQHVEAPVAQAIQVPPCGDLLGPPRLALSPVNYPRLKAGALSL